jgi:Ca-activated chloride channel family protein
VSELLDFHFLRPWWLLTLAPLGMLALRRLHRPPLRNPWRGIVDKHLLPHLLLTPAARTRRLPFLLLLLAWLVGVLALAGPTFSKAPVHRFRPDTPPLVLVLDLSRSMDAVDLSPSRLAIARDKLQSLMRRLPPRQLALVVYSLQAHSAMPLTEDRDLLGATLNVLETSLMPSQGSDAGAALALAYRLIERAGESRGDVLLVTDGVGEDDIAAARKDRPVDIRVNVYGLGTPAGGLIPLEAGGVISQDGRPVRPRLEAQALWALARTGQGTYVPYTPGDADIDSLLTALQVPVEARGERLPGQGETWKDQGPWLILPLLPLAALAFRRGWLVAVVLCVGLPPSPVEALDWQALWRNRDQQGLHALRADEPAVAAGLFIDPLWRGIAHYRNRDYPAAVDAFSGLDHPLAHYNRGNALVRLGRLTDARVAYEQALELDPSLQQARINLELVGNALAALPAAASQQVPPPNPPGTQAKPARSKPQFVQERLAASPPDAWREPEATIEPRPDLNERLGGGAMIVAVQGAADGKEGGSIGQGEAGSSAGAETATQGGARAGTAPGEHSPEGEASPYEHLETPSPQAPAASPDESSSPTGSPAVTEAAQAPGNPTPADEEEAAAGPAPVQTSEEAGDEPGGRAGQGADKRFPVGVRERRQAVEQWLARIPEDPGEFLRAKFLREYRRAGNRSEEKPPW